jgi:molybdenum cofactor cytidylyltransferase
VGTIGVPALFGRSLFYELLSLGDETGAKSIILQNPGSAAQFPFPQGVIDIDTRDDWEKLKRTVILNEVRTLTTAN